MLWQCYWQKHRSMIGPQSRNLGWPLMMGSWRAKKFSKILNRSGRNTIWYGNTTAHKTQHVSQLVQKMAVSNCSATLSKYTVLWSIPNEDEKSWYTEEKHSDRALCYSCTQSCAACPNNGSTVICFWRNEKRKDEFIAFTSAEWHRFGSQSQVGNHCTLRVFRNRLRREWFLIAESAVLLKGAPEGHSH